MLTRDDLTEYVGSYTNDGNSERKWFTPPPHLPLKWRKNAIFVKKSHFFGKIFHFQSCNPFNISHKPCSCVLQTPFVLWTHNLTSDMTFHYHNPRKISDKWKISRFLKTTTRLINFNRPYLMIGWSNHKIKATTAFPTKFYVF